MSADKVLETPSLSTVLCPRTPTAGWFTNIVAHGAPRLNRAARLCMVDIDSNRMPMRVALEAIRAASDFVMTTKDFNVPRSRKSRDLGVLTVTRSVTIRGRVERVDDLPLPENLKLSYWSRIGVGSDWDSGGRRRLIQSDRTAARDLQNQREQ